MRANIKELDNKDLNILLTFLEKKKNGKLVPIDLLKDIEIARKQLEELYPEFLEEDYYYYSMG